MKKILTILLIILSFVVNATTYYVSNSGNDSNDGLTTSTPFLYCPFSDNFTGSVTINNGDVIYFERSDVWLDNFIIDKEITISAYGSGSDPVLTGAEEITGWSVYSGNIYQATFTTDISQLFLNNVLLKAARYPNDGFFTVTSTNGTTELSSTEITSQASNYYAGATLLGKPTDWRLDTRTVSSSTGQTLTINSALSYTTTTSTEFILVNKLEFLDEAGEWYYDTTTNTVYLWTPNSDSPSGYTVKGSTIDTCISATSIDNISISGIEIIQYGSTGIYLTSCNNVVINDCVISNNQDRSIDVDGLNSTITNNVITRSTFGIDVVGDNGEISGNSLSNIALIDELGINGLVGGWSFAIKFNGDTKIVEYNSIINAGYNGLHFVGANCDIRYNYVENVNSFLQDGGAIYTFSSTLDNGQCDGTEIYNNIVKDCNGQGGIYMDDRSGEMLLYDNTVINQDATTHYTSSYPSYGMYFHNTKNITFRNNTIYDSPRGVRVTGSYGGNRFVSNTVNNLSTTPSQNGVQPIMLQNYVSNATISLDSNLYVDRTRTNILRDDDTGTNYTLSGWQTLTSDEANSTYIGTSLLVGETEQLYYNATASEKNVDLGGKVHKDLDGNTVISKELQPYTSVILIKTTTNITPIVNSNGKILKYNGNGIRYNNSLIKYQNN